MQNTISCTYPVQNAAYCTGLAANAGSSKMGKDNEGGRSTRVSAIVDALSCPFKACGRGVSARLPPRQGSSRRAQPARSGSY